jgi:hypothetical protein
MPEVVIDGVACAVTFEQLKQFDLEAAIAGISREEAARSHLARSVAAGKREEVWRSEIRRNASDTQASKEHLARMRDLAEAQGLNWREDDAFRSTARADAVAELEDLENLYSATGNGRCAWRALRIATENSLPLPPWVTTYLYDGAIKLDALQGGKQSAMRIAKVLELHSPGGQSSVVGRFNRQRVRFYVASYMERLIERDAFSFAAAAQAAAEESAHYLPKPVTAKTVSRWYREFKDFVGRQTEAMKHYRERALDGWPVHPHTYGIERLPPEQRKPIE